MNESYIQIVEDVINLLKDHQLMEAQREMHRAVKVRDEVDYLSRSGMIAEINRNIEILNRQIDIIRKLVDSFPDNEKIFARMSIQDVVETIYRDELCKCRSLKRRISRPS